MLPIVGMERSKENLFKVKIPYLALMTFAMAYALIFKKFKLNSNGRENIRMFFFTGFVIFLCHLAAIEVTLYYTFDFGFKETLIAKIFFIVPFLAGFIVTFSLVFIIHKQHFYHTGLSSKLISMLALPILLVQLSTSLYFGFAFFYVT